MMWSNNCTMLCGSYKKLIDGVKYASLLSNFKNKTQFNENILIQTSPTVTKEAENIVGNPSFLNFEWLLDGEEFSNVKLYIKKYWNTILPKIPIKRNLDRVDTNNIIPYGFIILLVAQANGFYNKKMFSETDFSHGILHKQRTLAKITELIKLTHLMHANLFNLQSATEISKEKLCENSVSLLSGDFILSQVLFEMAKLKNQDVFKLMNTCTIDFTQAEFIGLRDRQNIALPAKPKTNSQVYNFSENFEPYMVKEYLGHAKPEWTIRHNLNVGNLLAKSCQSVLKLSGHPINHQEQFYRFGRHFALAWQASLDKKPFQHGNTGCFSLVCAPLLFQLEHDPSLYSEIEKGVENVENINYDLLRKEVLNGPGLKKTENLQKEHCKSALKILNQLPSSKACNILENILMNILKNN